MRFFSQNFETLFLREYWNIRNGLQPAGRNQMVITFDDGFLDNYTWAFPILKKYGLKATIFVCPEFVDLTATVRPNLEDCWNKRASVDEINKPGYLSWEEMKIMVNSGHVDIQSHTMSHTKYFVSGELTGFHRPGHDCLYPVGNVFPERKPYHILSKDFEQLLPYGYPLFEEKSSVCARKVTINPSFTVGAAEALAGYDFSRYSFAGAFTRVRELYEHFRSNNDLVTETETEAAYMNRLAYEIMGSKQEIETRLGHKVEFLCWPHGDNNEVAHKMAMDAGYLAATSGNMMRYSGQPDRISARIGLHQVKNSRYLSLLKTKYKTGSALNRFPYSQVNSCYNLLKYGKRTV